MNLTVPVRNKQRAEDQTENEISLSKDLFDAMEKARKVYGLDRSNFLRMCISKELQRMKKSGDT